MVIVGFFAVQCIQNCTEMMSENATFFPNYEMNYGAHTARIVKTAILADTLLSIQKTQVLCFSVFFFLKRCVSGLH